MADPLLQLGGPKWENVSCSLQLARVSTASKKRIRGFLAAPELLVDAPPATSYANRAHLLEVCLIECLFFLQRALEVEELVDSVDRLIRPMNGPDWRRSIKINAAPCQRTLQLATLQ